MAEHFRAVAALTSRQLGGMLGWAQQEQDGAVYGVAYTLFHNGFGEPDDPDSSLVGEVPPW